MRPRVRVGLVGLAILVMAAALVPWGMNWFVVRQVAFEFECRGVGPRWALEWVAEDEARPRTGYWLDVRDLASAETAAITIEKPRRFLRRLPVYELKELEINWRDSAGGSVRVRGVEALTRVFDVERPVQRLDVAAWVGASAGEDGWMVLEERGHARLALPARPWQDAVIVYVGMVVMLLGVVAAAWLWLWVVRVWEGLVARLPMSLDPMPRRHPALAATAIVATVVVPVWMWWWAPMLIEGDGVAYVALALRFVEEPSIRHYDGWRLPGYAALIAPLVGMGGDYTKPIGVLHVVLAVAAPVFARLALARRVSSRWAWIGMLVTASNPMLVVWQRHVLAECLTTFLVMVLLYVLVCFEDRCRGAKKPGAGKLVWWAAGVGLFLGVCTLVRGNFQMALVLVPVFLGWAALRAVAWPRALVVGAACFVMGSAVLVPFYVHVRETFGVWAYTVGPGWHRAIRTWDNGVADWNQTGVMTFEEARTLRRRMVAKPVNEFQFSHYLGECTAYPVPAGTRFERARDIRGGVSAAETRDRLPDKHAEIVPKAIVSLMGFHVTKPGYFRGYSFALVRDFIGRPTPKPTTLRGPYGYLPTELREGVKRGANPIDLSKNVNAAVLGAAWDWARLARPWLSVLFLVAAWRLFVRGEVAMTAVSVLIAAHVVALPVLYFAGTDRYIMPWWGLADMVVICGIGRIAGERVGTGRPT